MADLDVTELLSDPTFVDPIKVITRVPTVNSKGENTLFESSRDTIGSVQPASGKTLMRLPEAMRVANVSSFWVKGEIVTSAEGKYPAQLAFRGRRFNVQLVFDWTNAGSGWSEGTCIAEVPAP